MLSNSITRAPFNIEFQRPVKAADHANWITGLSARRTSYPRLRHGAGRPFPAKISTEPALCRHCQVDRSDAGDCGSAEAFLQPARAGLSRDQKLAAPWGARRGHDARDRLITYIRGIQGRDRYSRRLSTPLWSRSADRAGEKPCEIAAIEEADSARARGWPGGRRPPP